MAMKCPWCSAENALGTSVCVSCGRTIFSGDSTDSRPSGPTANMYPLAAQQQQDRRCVGCGRAIAWDVMHCPYCGYNFSLGQQGTQPTVRQPRGGTSVGKIVAGIVIAVVIVLVILFVLAAAIPGILGSKATININVYSTHILFSVSYNLYIDGSLEDSGTLDAGYYVQYSYVHAWASSDSTSVTISATASGGGLGSTSDSEAITISDGGTYSVNLYV